MRLSKGFLEAISRDYMKFLLHEAGKAVCLESIMEQAERFEDVRIISGGNLFTPYDFALVGGRDSDIQVVCYGDNAEYGFIRNIHCYVHDGKVNSVRFTVDYNGGSLVMVTMDELYEEWSASELDFVGGLIDVFEDFLEEHKIVVENEEKDEAAKEQDKDTIANIYGSDYGFLSERLSVMLGY